jgi:hypothetical protein
MWRTRHEVQLGIFRWTEGWYNPRRIQHCLGWRSPLEYEAGYAAGEHLSIPATAKDARSSTPSSTQRLTAPAGRSRLEKASPTRRMDHDKDGNDPGFQIITDSNKPGEGQDQQRGQCCLRISREAVDDWPGGDLRDDLCSCEAALQSINAGVCVELGKPRWPGRRAKHLQDAARKCPPCCFDLSRAVEERPTHRRRVRACRFWLVRLQRRLARTPFVVRPFWQYDVAWQRPDRHRAR